MTATERVRDIGEFALIARLQAVLPEQTRVSASVTVGIGDDCAIWTPERTAPAVITTDMLVEDIHFRLGWTSWSDLGHKTLAVNLSDLAAMGATPVLATVSLGLRGDEAVADLEAMYRALGELAARTGCVIAGGDIVRSPNALTFSVTAIGECRHGPPLRRDGARPGDLIAVSGMLGAAVAGLMLLMHPDERAGAATAPALIMAHQHPEPRLALGQVLAEHGATAAMDLSDGLFGDLAKICAASGVAALVEEAALPVPAAVRSRFPDRWLDLATRGGEDYELLFAAPPAVLDDVAARCRAAGLPTPPRIGAALPAGAAGPHILLRRADGTEEVVRGGAFDHFGG